MDGCLDGQITLEVSIVVVTSGTDTKERSVAALQSTAIPLMTSLLRPRLLVYKYLQSDMSRTANDSERKNG